MKLDPNRLLVVIKDRHILIKRLEMALTAAKEDGMGDAFRINAMLGVQRKQLLILEEELKSVTISPEAINAAKKQDIQQQDKAAVNRIRAEIAQWIRYEL